MRFAVVDPQGGVVSNVIIGDDLHTVEEVVGSCVEETEATGTAGVGYTWDGETFVPPTPPGA